MINRRGNSQTVATSIPQLLKDAYGQGLEQMYGTDEAALLPILGGFIVAHANGQQISLEDAAEEFLPERFDQTTDEINRILEILSGVSVQDATEIIQLIAQ